MKKLNKNAKITKIEKIIINCTTPFEIISVMQNYFRSELYDFIEMNPRTKKFIEKYGFFKGIKLSKLTHYQRLINHSGKPSPKKGMELYNNTTCGSVMKLTYKIFREQ